MTRPLSSQAFPSYARVRCVTLAAALAICGCEPRLRIPVGAERCTTPGTDADVLGQVTAGTRSFWLQPWRGYQETRPASVLLDAMGAGDDSSSALLEAAGFTRVSAEWQWRGMSFDAPAEIPAAARTELQKKLVGFSAAHLRPLLVLHGWEDDPCPMRTLTLTVQKAAPAGSRAVSLAKEDVARVRPGRTAFSQTGIAGSLIFVTSIDAEGNATLSRALSQPLAMGAAAARELAFEPFTRPRPSNDTFERTLAGWIDYVVAVVGAARETLGDAFDVSLGLELTVGSGFLDIGTYYDAHPLAPASKSEVARVIVARTAAALRDRGVIPAGSGIRLVDGFAATDWTTAASTTPAGISALGRSVVSVVGDRRNVAVDGTLPLDARGMSDGAREGDTWRDGFVPPGRFFFPELPLTAILPVASRRIGQLVRDLAPRASADENGVGHGRVPRDGQGPLPVWITTINTNPGEDGGLSPDDHLHLQSKVAMRTLAAYVNKGVDAVFFFTQSNHLRLVDERSATGGEPVAVLKRFRAAFAPTGATTTRARQVRLVTTRACSDDVQIAGDGTPGRPSLVDRDLVAFFPFQVDDARVVAAIYVMTQDLKQVYQSGSGTGRFDRSPKPFDLVLEGVSPRASLSLLDPLTNESSTPVIREHGGGRVLVEVPLHDSVRLLTITEP